MACYRASHLAQKQMYPKLLNRKNIKETGGTISIEIKNPYERELKRFKQLVIANKWDTLITDYPIHRSPAFNRIANTLGTDKDCYEKTLVSLLENDEDLAEKLRQYIVMQPELIL